MTLGYNKPLYILPFDHRGSFQTGMFGWKGSLSPEQTAQIAAAKQVIYDGFKAAVAAGVAKERAGILVDEQFGAAILQDAAKHGYYTAAPAEKSGQDEFDFEYGDDFARHIETFNLTFCKVLVRYNPEADKDMNARQTRRCGSCPSICTTPIASICSSCSCRRRQSNCNRSVGTTSATISSGAPP